MAYDAICIGTLVRDIFLSSWPAESADSSGSPGQFCFPAGVKTEFSLMNFDAGGEAANTAVSLALLGLKTALVAKVGRDESGKALINDLKKKKVNCDLIKKSPRHQTGYGIMVVGEDGSKTALVYRGAAGQMEIQDVPLTKLKTRWLYLSSLGGNIDLLKRITSSASKKGIKIAFNPGPAEISGGLRNLLPVLRDVELLAMNVDEAVQLTKHGGSDDVEILFDALTVATPGMVLITDGLKGAYVSTRVSEEDAIYFAPSTGVQSRERTGAGDAFLAGFMVGISKDAENIEQALQLATLNAASVVKKIGAQAGLLKRMPSKNELNKIRVTKM